MGRKVQEEEEEERTGERMRRSSDSIEAGLKYIIL